MAHRNEETCGWQAECPEIRSAHLLVSREWSDCTFHFPTIAGAEDSEDCLHAHKLILAMASPVFAAMFYNNVGDKESPVIISDIDRPTFSALLRYIYTDEAVIANTEAATSLYKAANKYILVHLEKKCLDFLFKALEDPNNVCHIYEFSCFFGQKLLEEKCLEIFSTKIQFILKSPNFRYASTNTLKKIVSMDALDINSEFDLFNALLDYTDNCSKPDDSQNLVLQSTKGKKECDKQTCKKYEVNIASSAENKLSQSSTEKHEYARRILNGIIEEIRFLSMTPAELAKISESTILLSEKEMLAIYANKFSPNSSLLMPDGFSCIREPRIRGAPTFSHTFHNVTNMTSGENKYSPCYVRKLPWRILAQKNLVNGETEYLSLFLDCDIKSLPTTSEDWCCEVKFELRLHSVTKPIIKLIKTYEHNFCTEEFNWGVYKFIEWSELIDPNNNFTKDDSITVEVHFLTEPVQEEIKKDIKRRKVFK